jgi:DNA-binding IscR family transcriptional regulator
MLINARFTEAIHILCLIAIKDSNMPTSDKLASSINTNPVVIRRIFKLLKDAHLIVIKRGAGGCSLSKKPSMITLKDVYFAVEDEEKRQLFRFHQDINQNCIVGSNIEEVLSPTFDKAQSKMEEELKKTTIADVVKKIKLKFPE